MKVKELILELEKLPQNAKVFCYDNNGEITLLFKSQIILDLDNTVNIRPINHSYYEE